MIELEEHQRQENIYWVVQLTLSLEMIDPAVGYLTEVIRQLITLGQQRVIGLWHQVLEMIEHISLIEDFFI
jgi:hypothetical protein